MNSFGCGIMMKTLIICPTDCVAKVVDGECLYVKEYCRCLFPEIHPNLCMYAAVANMMRNVKCDRGDGMKVVFLKIKDPIEYRKPDVQFMDEDMEWIKNLTVLRIAGIVLHEDDNTITIGEAQIADDNPEMKAAGITFPSYRYVTTIGKCSIIDRQDFEVKGG